MKPTSMTAAIYLAHLNPMTRAHELIISTLLSEGYHVHVFPVRFLKDGREINTKSFPFPYQVRKQMVESVFGGAITVLPNYAFHAPFKKYLPPLLSMRSWELRNQIIAQIKENTFVSYTGDKAERLMLKAYRLNPLKATRLGISASSVRELIYSAATGDANEEDWRDKVPISTAALIKKNWETVEKFARTVDDTVRVMGMKFPKEGYR